MSSAVFSMLSDSDVEKVHAETLRLFETVGFKVTHEQALSKFAKAGAKVDPTSGLVRVPRRLVAELLAAAPSTAMLTGLNGKALAAGGDNRHYLSLVIDPYIIDYEAGPRRPVLQDVLGNTIVGESLDRIGAMHRMQFPVADVAGADGELKTAEVFLSHTTKHVASCPVSVADGRLWMDVMAVIADAAGLDVSNTPLMTIAMAVTSPLQVHGPNVELMKMAMERCYPIIPTVCPMAGTTSPYSMAGSFVQANAESLMATLIAQLYNPGHPCFYHVSPSVTEMRTGRDLFFKAEAAMFKTMAGQMGAHYNLPMVGEGGGTITHRPDVQAGAESMMVLLAGHATGHHLFYGMGSNYNANGMSPENVVMACSLVEMAEFITRGIDLSDHKLAHDSISRVGPGGNYLTDELTLELLRSDEFMEGENVDYTGGYGHDGAGMLEIAHQKVADLIANYKPTVPERVREAIRKFFTDKYQDTKVASM